jgi:hypothetical protein
MKKIALFSLIALVMSCGSMKQKNIKLEKPVFEKMKHQDANFIYNERYQIIPNTRIELIKDKFGIGYIELKKSNKTVFYYKYNRKPVDKKLMDGGYIEEISFEWDGPLKETELKDNELSKVNMLVGKQGFFRGSGFYKVTKGSLSIKFVGYNKVEINIEIEKPSEMIEVKKIHKIIELNQE